MGAVPAVQLEAQGGRGRWSGEWAGRNEPIHIKSLDGLRLIAFLLVFFHHLPEASFSTQLVALHAKGWMGVDIFFALSAFLLTTLLLLEIERQQNASFAYFMVRRALRICPLLYAYVLVCLAFYDKSNLVYGLSRTAGLLLFIDNFVCWVNSYSAVPHTAHLWTLAFEMQFYPFLFVFATLISRNLTLALQVLLGVFVFGLAARAIFVGIGAPHPVIWVTPFLRPDSILAGVLVAVAARLNQRLLTVGIILVGLAALGAFVTLPMPLAGSASTIGTYVVVGLISGGAVLATLKIAPLRAILGCRPVAFLGKISYGLYVFHFTSILMLQSFSSLSPSLHFRDYILFAAVAFLMTFAAAATSWFLLERPFLRLKERFELVPSRPA